MADINWIAWPVDHKISRCARGKEVTDHPLKPQTITAADGRSGRVRRGIGSSAGTPTRAQAPNSMGNPLGEASLARSALDGSDPLTRFASDESDPLSRMAADEWDYCGEATAPGGRSRDAGEEHAEPWSARRSTILSKYTTSEKLSIATSFLSGGEKVKGQQTGTLVDKVRTRLEQLDDFEEGSVRHVSDLSQQEYATRIEQLNAELVQAWHSDQRVKALKIAIQCAKLLVDTSVIVFYPSKFVLVTDILDIFGKLVYERLRTKADSSKPSSKGGRSLPENFTSDMVPESAKETCRNWFYKIASIRELVPRLYVETAIIKSYSFLTNDEFAGALLRITRMIRGIGNPLVAVYARCYLCRVGLALDKTSDYEFVRENFYEFLATYRQLFGNGVRAELAEQGTNLYTYLNLYAPALDWILKVIARTASESLLADVLSRCKRQPHKGLLLNAVLVAFDPAYVAARSMEFADSIAECDGGGGDHEDDNGECDGEDGFPRYLLYRSLGECLVRVSPPKEDCQSVLNLVWNYTRGLQDARKFMHCIEIWIQFTAIHFTVKELNLFLGEIINKLGPNRSFEQYYPQLQAIVEKIVAHTQDFESLLTMDNFLPLIDTFHKESVKVEVCKSVIEGFGAQNGPITDPIVINGLMFIARIMHDSVSALTVDDEKRQIGNLICGLVQRVDYGRDFEKQLNFYAEARAAFPNLDTVHVQLVRCVNKQAVDTRKIVRGHHTRRTSAFVRACAAFCFITIPSLTLVQTRLQLYLLSGQVALLNQCLGQADACFKAALSLVPEMPKTIEIEGRPKNSESYLLSYLSNFLSTLLVVPDSPEHGVLYLMRGLLNAVQRCFEENTSTKAHLYLRVLDLLSTVTQETYPYHVDKVDSNDKLYGSDRKFVGEVNKICTKVLEEILSHLKYLGSSDQTEKQSALALELFGRLIARADLRQPGLASLAVSLWILSQKYGSVDPKLRVRTIEYVRRKSRLPRYQHLTEILLKMTG